LRNTYIYTETTKLIKKFGTRDPFEIMDQMHIVVMESSRYQKLKGYCFMSCKTIYVMISSFLSEEDDTLYNMTDNTEYQAICLLPIY